MRVADAVRETSIVARLKVGEKFTDGDGDWIVVRSSEIHDNGVVTVFVRAYPDGKRTVKYDYDRDFQVRMIRN